MLHPSAILALLLATAQARLAEQPHPDHPRLVLEGLVLAPDGAPAEGAVVLSSAGGQAVTDARGRYRLELELPAHAEAVQVTAVGRAGANQVASRAVSVVGGARAGSLPLVPLELVTGGSCAPSWLPTFGSLHGFLPTVNAEVRALAVFDDGSGPALYVGGVFSAAGTASSDDVARWDGTQWVGLGEGVAMLRVHTLLAHDDGSGPALYAGGDPGGLSASGLARWDGIQWTDVGGGVAGVVLALAEHDGGSGVELYAGGLFTSAGGVPANRIARWDGALWSALGSGANNAVLALASHDDGTGPALFAAGTFTSIGGGAAARIARWGGAGWTALGSGINGSVNALVVHDEGAGARLFAGGNFNLAGGTGALRMARWDGSAWSAVGLGSITEVTDLAVLDEGSGPALYLANQGGVRRWDGSAWSEVGGASNGAVYALATFDEGGGARLFAGGYFDTLAGTDIYNLARWDGAGWSAVTSGTAGLGDGVRALTIFDDGSGPALYVGGLFDTAVGLPVQGIAKWNGTGWQALDGGAGGILGIVYALAAHDDGSGPALFAGGVFLTAGGVTVNHVARWNGTSWSSLAGGIAGILAEIDALAVFDDGTGPALYAAGAFTSAGGVPANRIARWNGASWSALGSGLDRAAYALAVHDDGTGSALYVGGRFESAGGASARYVARWDGASWSPLGSGMNNLGWVYSLASFDDGAGARLHAGGLFTSAGGVAANRIARWNGGAWSALGSGVDDNVTALVVHDDGTGTALYAGGFFRSAGGIATTGVARWNGTAWSALGGGLDGPSTRALVSLLDGTQRSLIVGGDFASTVENDDSFLARYGCLDTTPPVLTLPEIVFKADLPPYGTGEIVHFIVSACDDLDLAPVVTCTPPSGSLFPVGVTHVTCTATDASGNASTGRFRVTIPRRR